MNRATEPQDEADEAFGGTTPRAASGAQPNVPPHARADTVGRGHRFAAHARCWADTEDAYGVAEAGPALRAFAWAARQWGVLSASLARPYPVTLPMLVLMALVPLYLFIPGTLPGRPLFVPELAIDRLLPVVPAWSIVYGTAYAFLIVLPVLVVREVGHVRRTYVAYLLVWGVAFAFFLLFPTVAPRPDKVVGTGFAAWGLRFLYSADPPNNCFPSLHVAHSFVSALSCYRIHRTLGAGAAACAMLVGVSTLFSKQHYVLDVVGGMLLAALAYVVVLRGCPREQVPEIDQRVAPAMALAAAGIAALGTMCLWVAYLMNLP
jgi:membrane-associated phospholipid phosphatase